VVCRGGNYASSWFHTFAYVIQRNVRVQTPTLSACRSPSNALPMFHQLPSTPSNSKSSKKKFQKPKTPMPQVSKVPFNVRLCRARSRRLHRARVETPKAGSLCCFRPYALIPLRGELLVLSRESSLRRLWKSPTLPLYQPAGPHPRRRHRSCQHCSSRRCRPTAPQLRRPVLLWRIWQRTL
jgi:hypothetical protein